MSSDFFAAWQLSRGRLDADTAGLTQSQLNWRLHAGTLTIGEMLLHVAGVELWFISQLTDRPADERVCRCATDGVVNELPFPFAPEEITPDLVGQAMAAGREAVEAAMPSPSADVLERQMKSALGPIIDGRGAFTRLAFHSAYHQGQVQLIRTAPGFPAAAQ